MKEYILRLKQGSSKQTLILWTVIRILLLAAFVANFFKDTFTITGQLHIGLCLIGSFFWEFSQMRSHKSLFRLIPPSIHTAINIGLFVSAVFGVYFNFYYTVRFFDLILQVFFSFVSVLYGYEIAYAIVKRDRISATKAMIFFVAFGLSFISFNIWELGEFFCDQLIGHITGEVGNAQFWSMSLAEGTQRAKSIIPPLVSQRNPLMDIMCDIIGHSISAFAALIFINVCPYRLRGKYKYDTDYGNGFVKETVE